MNSLEKIFAERQAAQLNNRRAVMLSLINRPDMRGYRGSIEIAVEYLSGRLLDNACECGATDQEGPAVIRPAKAADIQPALPRWMTSRF
jgi:hypothetical protein